MIRSLASGSSHRRGRVVQPTFPGHFTGVIICYNLFQTLAS
jgi:hypothetical protein